MLKMLQRCRRGSGQTRWGRMLVLVLVLMLVSVLLGSVSVFFLVLV